MSATLEFLWHCHVLQLTIQYPLWCCRALKDSLTDNEGKGFIKVVVNAKTDRVLGIHLVGPEVAEILQVSRSVLHFGSSSSCV